jgi:FAD:protein FMN transferase
MLCPHALKTTALKLFKFSFAAMACQNELQFYWQDEASAHGVARDVIAEVQRIEAKYSRYRDDSTLTGINRSAGMAASTVDAETAALLTYANACYSQSGGLFDITSGVLRRAWNFREPRIPTQLELDALLPLVGWQKLTWQNPVLWLPAGMEIDFGGIGKEYAADRAGSVALERGIRHGFINLGGDIRVLGPHPDNTPWLIGITHPRKNNAVLASMAIPSGALATSGDYERFFELDGKRYSHILDPRTGYPVTGLQSVTVVGPLCTVAGSLCTIAMLKGNEGGSFLAVQELPWLAVDSQGRISGPLAVKI